MPFPNNNKHLSAPPLHLWLMGVGPMQPVHFKFHFLAFMAFIQCHLKNLALKIIWGVYKINLFNPIHNNQMEVFAPIFWPFWPSWSSYEKMSFYNILALQIIGAVCRINLFDPVHRKQMVVFVISFWPSWPYSLSFFGLHGLPTNYFSS